MYAHGLCLLWWIPKCSTIKLQSPSCGRVLYGYISKYRYDTRVEFDHVLHICGSYGEIGGGVGMKGGEIKWKGGDTMLMCKSGGRTTTKDLQGNKYYPAWNPTRRTGSISTQSNVF